MIFGGLEGTEPSPSLPGPRENISEFNYIENSAFSGHFSVWGGNSHPPKQTIVARLLGAPPSPFAGITTYNKLFHQEGKENKQNWEFHFELDRKRKKNEQRRIHELRVLI